MSIEKQVILDKLTGRCPIHCVEAEGTAYDNGTTPMQESPAAPPIAADNTDPRAMEQYFREIDRCLKQMDINRENYAFRHLYSCRAVIGKAIVFAKRVVRKCLKWYVEPICNQQTEFNNAVTPAIGRLTQLQRGTLDTLHWVEEEVNASKTMGNNIAAQILHQQQKIAEMDDTNARLQQRMAEIEGINSQLQQNNQTLQSQLSEIMAQFVQLKEQDVLGESADNENVIKKSTSQSGEDMISEYVVRVLGKNLKQVTYLDLGANHAKLYSNTYHFYQKGVRGVLVEANPALIGELKLFRAGDVILNRCVASTSGETVDFYVLNGDGLSTPDKAGAEAAIAENPTLKIERVVPVRTITVEEILETYFDQAPTIVNLDIEGEEMNVLRSIDFTKYRPLLIIIETIPYRKHLVVGEKNQEIVAFMREKNYVEYAFTGINSIFLDKEQIAEVLG